MSKQLLSKRLLTDLRECVRDNSEYLLSVRDIKAILELNRQYEELKNKN